MTCYLHIGTEKTGTTTIQKFLDDNSALLLDGGILHPQSIGKFSHFDFHSLGFIFPRQDCPYTQIYNLHSEQSLKAHQLKIFQRFQEELNSTKPQKVIISSELIQSRLRTKEEIFKLHAQLKKLGFKQIYIIIYLRNPADLFISMYSQGLKIGEDTEGIESPMQNSYATFVCSHQQTLQNWGEVFGKEQLIVRLFDKNEFYNQNLLDDFLHSINISKSPSFSLPTHQNATLDLIGMELCKHINRLMPRFENGVFNRQRRKLELLIDEYLNTHSNPDLKFMPPKEIYKSYIDFFQDSNEFVRQNFFPHKEKLFQEIDLNQYQENYRAHIIDEKSFEKIAQLIVKLSQETQQTPQGFLYQLADIYYQTPKYKVPFKWLKAIIKKILTKASL